MTALAAIWEELDDADPSGTGYALRRLHPATGHDLFAAVAKPSQSRLLIYEIPADEAPQPADLPSTKALRLTVETAGGVSRVTLELIETTLVDLFSAVVQDIADATAASPDPSVGVKVYLERFEHWRELFEALGTDGLNAQARRGLFGELFVLERLIAAGMPPAASVACWTGPLRAHQDFQLPALAIEVKTTAAKQPQSLIITSERELDDTGVDELYLAHLSFDERRGGHGQSLNALVDRLMSAVSGLAAATELRLKLQAVGYLPIHRDHYHEPRYTPRAVKAYRVVADFPRIVESGLVPGVGDVRYKIATTACTPYEVAWQKVEMAVNST